MKFLAAYILATLGGNESPKAADVKSILSSVGIEADDERISALISAVGGKDINELIAEGQSKLATVPSGGAAAAAPSGGAAAGGAAASGAKEEKKKEEEKEESDDDMGFGLFD